MKRINRRFRSSQSKGAAGRGRALTLAQSVGGQGLVELVLAIPVFTILFFGIYEFSRYYSTRLRLRTTVAEATRFAATGNQLVDPDTGDPIPRGQSIKTSILDRVAHFGVTDSDIVLSPPDGGGPEEVVTVTLNYEYNVAIPVMEGLLGTGVLDFSVATSMRNEPFHP